MCGIAGIVDIRETREIDRIALKRMTDALRHRGPDGEGFYTAAGVGFGHRRLAIIDREGGVQPFHTASRRGVLAYNGEIYNYQDLALELAGDGLQMQTRSDTEALAEGFARHGPAFLNRARGMFAFAFWDIGARRLTLARDRFGEKPLYYAETADGFLVFASEIGAVIASGLVALDLDETAVADYCLYGFIPDPKSVYRAIRKLPPASVLTVERGGAARIAPYWSLEFHPRASTPFEQACEELRAHLDEAVRMQLVSDVPLGAFLSGGVDSSAIVASMAAAGVRPKTSTIGFGEASHDERAYARTIAALYDTEHSESEVDLNLVALAPQIAAAYGEPFADSSALPTWRVSEITRRKVTVALSGDGADELFSGYRRYALFEKEEAARRLLPAPFRRAVFSPLGAVWPKLDFAPRPLRWKTTFEALGSEPATAYAHAMAANLPWRMRQIVSEDFRRALAGYRPESVVEAHFRRGEPALLSMQRADIATWLPGRMLTKIDRASMAHSLETRAPFLDVRFAEWSAALPPAFKLGQGTGKRVLKAAMEPRAPKDILYRPKMGFSPPVAAWLRAEGGPLPDLLESPRWRGSGVFDVEATQRMAALHRSGRADCSQELWTVLMFDAFLNVRPVRASAADRPLEIAPARRAAAP